MNPQATAGLQIGTDPTLWVVSASQAEVAGQLTQATSPISLQVVGPVEGQLVLSARSAGSVLVVSSPSDVGGVHPTGDAPGGAHAAVVTSGGVIPEGVHPTGAGALMASAVHLPSVTAATTSSPGYLLASGTEFAPTVADIVDAMTKGTRLTLQLGVSSGGILALNGAALTFAVVVRAGS